MKKFYIKFRATDEFSNDPETAYGTVELREAIQGAVENLNLIITDFEITEVEDRDELRGQR